MNRKQVLLVSMFLLMILPLMADGKPRNIIFLIGDGMGLAQTHAGMVKNIQPLAIESFKHIGLVNTSSSSHFTTDSGAGGTALASGVKTKNGMIGMDPDSVAIESIIHLAAKNRLATGIVASCAVTHATPASFVAHQVNRNMYEEIAADFLKVDIDVFIGGGMRHFANRTIDNRNLVNELKSKQYQVVESMQALKQVKTGKVAGLLYNEHPPAMPDRGDFLPDATDAAITLLAQSKKGFFLMVEGAQIDWAGHANDTETIALEVIDFDKAVRVALDFAQKDGNTLVVVTADHETGAMSLLGGDTETGVIRAAYSSTNHSGILVPVYAYGPGAEEFMGFIDNTEFKGKFADLLKLK
jgi:alkaline phosphatase